MENENRKASESESEIRVDGIENEELDAVSGGAVSLPACPVCGQDDMVKPKMVGHGIMKCYCSRCKHTF